MPSFCTLLNFGSFLRWFRVPFGTPATINMLIPLTYLGGVSERIASAIARSIITHKLSRGVQSTLCENERATFVRRLSSHSRSYLRSARFSGHPARRCQGTTAKQRPQELVPVSNLFVRQIFDDERSQQFVSIRSSQRNRHLPPHFQIPSAYFGHQTTTNVMRSIPPFPPSFHAPLSRFAATSFRSSVLPLRHSTPPWMRKGSPSVPRRRVRMRRPQEHQATVTWT